MILEEEIRKGPWTEHEDVQLVFYVNMFGDRRWDFIAKVSGLKRTGKSCRLRWVNYLHPGLKRGKMTPHEERLVLELHNKWGNRWSRIARKLPGRTDNEIKNYWRTHMRKKAQERKKAIVSSSSFSANSSVSSTTSSSSTMNTVAPSGNKIPNMEADDRSFYDTGGLEMVAGGMKEKAEKEGAQEREKGYSMDDIWREIDEGYSEEGGCNLSSQTVDSTIWDYCYPDMQWMMDEEESKMLFPANLTG